MIKIKDKSAETLLVSFAVIITVTILIMGFFDSPKYKNSESSGFVDSGIVTNAAENGKIDINNATAEELTALYQIGPVRANEIIKYREENGGFYSAEELLCIEKIPQSVYHKIKDKITVGTYTEGKQ